jgi:error-prone DNA polymerase
MATGKSRIALRPMKAGGEVVEDYGHVGLTLRQHPVSFLCDDLQRRRIVTCRQATRARDGKLLETAGVVLVRQMPGSAKGVMFITIEDETAIANLVVWPHIFEKYRRTVLGAGMMAVRGRIQREGEVVHLIAYRIADLSGELARVGERDGAFPLPHGRGDEAHAGGGADQRGQKLPLGVAPRDMYVPNLRLGSGIVPGQPTEGIKVKPKDFK